MSQLILTGIGDVDLMIASGNYGFQAEVEASYPVVEYRKALDHARQQGRIGKILFRP